MQKRDFIMHDNLDKPAQQNPSLPFMYEKIRGKRKPDSNTIINIVVVLFLVWLIALGVTWFRDDGYNGYQSMFNVILWSPIVISASLGVVYVARGIRDVVFFDGIEQNKNILQNDIELEKLRLQVRIEEAKAMATMGWVTNAPSNVTNITPKDKEEDVPDFGNGGKEATGLLASLLDE